MCYSRLGGVIDCWSGIFNHNVHSCHKRRWMPRIIEAPTRAASIWGWSLWHTNMNTPRKRARHEKEGKRGGGNGYRGLHEFFRLQRD